MAGVEMVHVAYKGGGPAMTDLIGGQVSLMFDQILTSLPHVQSGRLRGLAVTTANRSPAAPQIPTIAEAALPGYAFTTWHGLLAPAGTPREIVNRLHAEVVRVLRIPEVHDQLTAQGADIVGNSPEEFAAWIKVEVKKWSDVVRVSGAKVD